MFIKSFKYILVVVLSIILSGCLGSIWTGASVIYDRHNWYKKISDYQLLAQANNALFQDEQYKSKNFILEIGIFRGSILLVGHVQTEDLVEEASKRVLNACPNSRLYNHLEVSSERLNSLLDSWITTKIRTFILGDSNIDPNTVKVITFDQKVYLMGEMKKLEAKKVVDIARNMKGVKKVVNLMRYYTYIK